MESHPAHILEHRETTTSFSVGLCDKKGLTNSYSVEGFLFEIFWNCLFIVQENIWSGVGGGKHDLIKDL